MLLHHEAQRVVVAIHLKQTQRGRGRGLRGAGLWGCGIGGATPGSLTVTRMRCCQSPEVSPLRHSPPRDRDQ